MRAAWRIGIYLFLFTLNDRVNATSWGPTNHQNLAHGAWTWPLGCLSGSRDAPVPWSFAALLELERATHALVRFIYMSFLFMIFSVLVIFFLGAYFRTPFLQMIRNDSKDKKLSYKDQFTSKLQGHTTLLQRNDGVCHNRKSC